MKNKPPIIVITIAILILFGVIVGIFLQNREILPPTIEVVLPEQRFRS
jgi:hypothetical protein